MKRTELEKQIIAAGIELEDNEMVRYVQGTDKRYAVSNLGRPFSIIRKPRELKPYYNKRNGYGQVNIRLSGGARKQPLIHRLVAEAFIPNDRPGVAIEVNHKDFNKKNNTVDNLEWTTPQENYEHAVKNGAVGNEDHINKIYRKTELSTTPNHKRHAAAKVYKVYNQKTRIVQETVGMEDLEIITGLWAPTLQRAIRTGEVIKGFEITYLGKVGEYYKHLRD